MKFLALLVNSALFFAVEGMKDIGEQCMSDGECESSYCDYSGTGLCANNSSMKNIGEQCMSDGECASSYCDYSGTGLCANNSTPNTSNQDGMMEGMEAFEDILALISQCYLDGKVVDIPDSSPRGGSKTTNAEKCLDDCLGGLRKGDKCMGYKWHKTTSQCTLFFHMSPPDPTHSEHSFPKISDDINYISGVSACAQPCYVEIELTGTTLSPDGELTTPSAEECKGKCGTRAPLCGGFKWHNTTSLCTLLSDVDEPTSTKNGDYLSGMADSPFGECATETPKCLSCPTNPTNESAGAARSNTIIAMVFAALAQ